MQVVAVNGAPRENLGKKWAKTARKEGTIPCVLYGGKEVKHFTTTHNNVKSLIYTADFKLAELTIDGATSKCIVKDVQFHPVKDNIIHIDFLELVPEQVVKVEVPVRFEGSSPGVKVGGKLIQSLRRVKIKTTPENMVDELKLDISELELGSAIRVRDIQAVDGVEIMNSPGIPVASVEIPRALRSAAAAAEKDGGAEAAE